MAPKKFGVNELREMFLKFFETKGHLRLPSFSLIPQNDASLLLINSGMAPMKPYFTGEKEPPRHRVTTCQKCIRTGDIDNIGHTARHGTYFEMLGNFSFGDYFKTEAIHWAWEFLTSPQWVGLDPQRLYPSIYQNDEEAFRIWHEEMGIPAERIFRFGKEDNFWEHGSGPCGPCSEIYYDRGERFGCGKPGCTVGCECDRYMEVWNIVFSQFNNDGQGNYTDLIQKNIDTGMGLERLAVVCQDVDSLFDVDTVMNITNKVSEITGAHYEQSVKTDVSLRVITDHIRSATFMIADGVLPSNEGRGYVLRRLLRRAARHGKLLGVDKPFLYEVCDTVIRENEGHYPELRERQEYITKVIRTEENNFARTLSSGLSIFNDMLGAHRAGGEQTFSGADAFKLYDTYGFPIDLTLEMARDQGMDVDEEGFRALMQEQKERARKAREALGDLGWAGIEFGKDMPETRFTGYDPANLEGFPARVLAIVSGSELCGEAAGGDAILVLDETPFYAEMGGQSADHGVITCGGASFQVTDVQKNKGGKYMHYGRISGGSFRVGGQVACTVDLKRRKALQRAHSATHLLDAALRKVLGAHVQQAGSLVEPDRLRFDFTHFSAMTPEQLSEVSRIVNEAILEGYDIHTDVMPIEEARQRGAIALFGEKYGSTVRVVDIGSGFSVEFCGGTHLDNTAKAGVFHIESEFSVASGVRRIEATTGFVTLETLNRNQDLLFEAAAALKAKPAELRDRAQQAMQEIRDLRRNLDALKAREAAGEVSGFLMGAKQVGPVKVLTATVPNADANKLRQMGDMIRDREPGMVAVLSSVNGGKISFLCACGKDAVEQGLKAGEIIRAVTAACGGKGGGKSDFAMGGGSDLMRLDDALALVDNFVAGKLGV